MSTPTDSRPPQDTPRTPRRGDLAAEIGDLWRTRPVVDPDDRKIGGIAAAFGRRYDVDPLIVRVAFVAAALVGGGGVFIYAMCWLLLRITGERDTPAQALLHGRPSVRSKWITVVIALVALASMPVLGESHGLAGVGLVSALALLAGWYGLYRLTPVVPARPAPAPAGPTPGAPAAGEATEQMSPPDWDPLGAAPFAWDLPNPAVPVPPARRRPRSRVASVTLGIALLVAVAGTFLGAIVHLAWFDAARVGALSLAVVGVGLLVGAVLRRGHGLLAVAVPLAAFVAIAAWVPGHVDREGLRADADGRTVVATDSATLPDTVSTRFGTVTLDLRELHLDADRTVSASSVFGDVTVLLPPGIETHVSCATKAGDVDCPTATHPAGDGHGGPVLTVDATSRLGSVEVH